MRVSRLEIFGFKSFMDRLVLPLEGGITGVVGPNGCGKSNIVDAIRWVLGETKASSLRGGTLEDVIFNGTDKLRPLGLAEVTLTLRAQEANFFDDLISPQLEVEQLLKNVQKDIEEQESEIVAQDDENKAVKFRVIEGRLGAREDVPPEASTEDTPHTQEEIATTILSRFSWLKSVSEVQITRRLYRSGESEFFINRVPCRLKDIKDFYRAIGLGARAYTIVAQGEVSRIVTSKPEERRLILEEAAGVIGFRDKIAASNRKLEETGQHVVRLKDVINEVDRQVVSLKRQAQRAQNRQKLKDDIAQLETAVFREKCLSFHDKRSLAAESFHGIKQSEESMVLSLQALETEEAAHRMSLSSLDHEADSLRGKIDSFREELLNRARSKSARTARVNEIRAFNLARATEIRRLEERRATLKGREAESLKGMQELKLKESQLQEQIQGITLVSEEELQTVAYDLKSARERLKAKEGEIRSIRDKVVSTSSSLQALQDQIIAASPINQLKKTIEADKVQALVPKVHVFVEGLIVPPQYAKAVQSVLSEKAAFLVAENPDQIAEAFLSHLGAKDGKEKKGMGIGIFKAGDATYVQTMVEALPFPRMLDCIEVKERFRYAAERVLSNVYIAESAEQAFSYFHDNPGAAGDAIVVTVDGDIVTSHSFYSLRHDGGLIQLQSRVRELQDNLQSFEQIERTLTGEKDSLQKEVGDLETKQSEVLRESELRQRTLRDLSNQQSSLRGRLQAEERLHIQVQQDIEKIALQMSEIELKIEESKKEEADLLEIAAKDITHEDSVIEDEIKMLAEALHALDAQRKEGRMHLSELSDKCSAIRKELEKLRAQHSQAELEIQKLELEQDNIKLRVVSEYGEEAYQSLLVLDPETARISDAEVHEFEQEAMRIKNRIVREGEVDSTSIERYEEESKRLSELEQQLSDLEEAVSVLNKTIVRLEEVSKQRFVSMFHAVNKNFSRLIPQLFGGGRGALELVDPSNPLESGIDIVMRPPGKKPKSIDLLSGGEKALCATALIFSMFLEKPSPLCVLDEVDAPLDEANLIRFLTLVKELSTKTQFMLVTHNKRSMTTAEHLVGVTMQEPGASKVISVSLQEAQAQVA